MVYTARARLSVFVRGLKTDAAYTVTQVQMYTAASLAQPTRTVRCRRPRITPTSIYVRIRVPDCFACEVNNPVELTTDVIKFGMAYKVPARDSAYVHRHEDHDNGFMAFSFECDTRAQASAVERIVRAQVEEMTVFDSFEYVDVTGLAAMLGHESAGDVYENYVTVARKLFVHMVETAKLVFPGKYLGHYGSEYQVRKTSAKRLTGSGQVISSDLAVEYGFRTPAVSWTPVSTENFEPLTTMGRHVCEEVSDVTVWRSTPFEDVPIFALMEDGDAMLRNVSDDAEQSADADKAGKALHDYAIKMWRIAPERIDKDFYTQHVVDKGAYERFYRAKRFVMANTQPRQAHQQRLKEKVSAIMLCNDPNVNLYKSLLKQHYARLFAGQSLLEALLNPDQLQSLMDDCVTVNIAAVENACRQCKSQIDPSELKATLRLFDMTESTTDFIMARKILRVAFGVELQRQSKRSNLAAFKRVDINVRELKSIANRYKPGLLARLFPE